MDWNNVYAAGGAVLACICNPPMDETFKGSDIDLFIWGIYDEETANNKVRIKSIKTTLNINKTFKVKTYS